jgi:hypothetical protein
VNRIEAAKRPLGRNELKRFSDWKDGRPETELNFRYKIASVSDHTAAFLNTFFDASRLQNLPAHLTSPVR